MFRLLSMSHPQALHNYLNHKAEEVLQLMGSHDIPTAIALLQLYGLGNCVRPEEGSLKGTETCCLHRCYKFVQ
jgi:hypothetical protein